MPRKIRTLADEREYSSLTLPSIERRSLMESGMRPPTTRTDVAVVIGFLLCLAALLAFLFLGTG
jgi:hypothetical protein